ncbi:MAG: response regulator [Candidatus Omnitrophota bacterium]
MFKIINPRTLIMKRILIIEDEDRVRKIYTQLLTDEGFEVIESSDASEAYDVLNKGGIDLVLLDIKMPVVFGSILYEVMQSFHDKVKVIVASVYPLDEQKRIVKGAIDYHDKSHGTQLLLEKVKKALAENN